MKEGNCLGRVAVVTGGAWGIGLAADLSDRAVRR